MILRELFYFDKDTMQPVDIKSYEAGSDDSIINLDDTRKTRLTLRQINRARKAGEFHKEEQAKELELVRNMYGAANQPEM
jgi:hypothetical protein